MRATAMKDLWPFQQDGVDPAVVKDAARLQRLYGEQACSTAGLYSWREDIGLLYTPKPGHWNRVKLEIESRDEQNLAPVFARRAKIQMLHLM